MANKNIKLATNKGFARVYASTGHIATNHRGRAIVLMMSFVKDDETLISAYRKYRKAVGQNSVTYARFFQLVTPFLWIKETPYCNLLLEQLDNDPSKTLKSALNSAWKLADFHRLALETISVAA